MDEIESLQETELLTNQARPNNTKHPLQLWALQVTTTGAPLPQGDALIAHENVKREKSCPG